MATILFSFVGSCIQKIQGAITEEAIQVLGVEQELRNLQQTMTYIQCFLKDADRRQIEDSAISNWLSELKDAMYDADDIIDLSKYKGFMLLGVHPSSSPSSSSKKLSSCIGFPLMSCFSTVCTRRDVAIQIRSLNQRIERIAELGRTFKFETEPAGSTTFTNMRKTSYLVEPNLVGKEIAYATNRLAKLVLEHREKKAYKIGIVGMGGVGKTTLAQKLYNDQRVKGSFKKHAWICVSQQYSEVTLLKEILRNIGEHQEQGESIGELEAKLAEAVKEESFFLVLDDLWQPDVWINLLRTPLHAAAEVTVIVTTRYDTVAKAIGVEHMERVEVMSNDVGWELLWKSMIINDEKEVYNLRDTGMEIVQKCGGLPLTIRIIASVLVTKEKKEIEWRKILSNDAWSMNKLPAELRGALYLSYDQLPQNLKQCFLYCGLYPEDWTLFRDDLVRFWVAEGFVEKHENQLLEDTAEEYYYELISRNLLIPDPEYVDQDRCKMHDLLRQLAHHLSAKECFQGDPQSLEGSNISRVRRISNLTAKDRVVLPNLDKQHFRARTLLNDISYLPESIGSLINLQILNLQGCGALLSLPLGITRLCNLRRLGLAGTPINQVPKGIGVQSILQSSSSSFKPF